MLGNKPMNILVGNFQRTGGLGRNGGRNGRMAREHRQLTEELARFHMGEPDITLRPAINHVNRAGLDDDQRDIANALVINQFARQILPAEAKLRNDRQFLRPQAWIENRVVGIRPRILRITNARRIQPAHISPQTSGSPTRTRLPPDSHWTLCPTVNQPRPLADSPPRRQDAKVVRVDKWEDAHVLGDIPPWWYVPGGNGVAPRWAGKMIKFSLLVEKSGRQRQNA